MNSTSDKRDSSLEIRYDVFISYSHKDAELYGADLIQTIKNEIEADLHDITCRPLVFLDSEALGYGDEWQAKIQEKIQECRVFICLLSENYLQSTYCTRERLWWERKEIQRGSLRQNTLPVYFIRLSACDLFLDQRRKVRDLASFQMEPVPWFDGGREAVKSLYLQERIDNLKRAVRNKLMHIDAAESSFNSVIPQPTRNFVGRILELKELREICAGNRFPVIEGGAGVGKTELAAVYAYGYAGEYPQGRFLIHMEGKRSWEEAILSIVQNPETDPKTGTNAKTELEITDEDMRKDERSLHRLIVDRLFARARAGRLLLVLDNVDDASLFRERKLLDFSCKNPIPENIHMIATTRHELVFPERSRAKAFPLGNLDDDASFELFCEIGENMFSFCRHPVIDEESDEEYQAVMEIIHLLEGHVWSLEILAGQVAEKYLDGATFQKKLKMLEKNLTIQGRGFRSEAQNAVELLRPTMELIRSMEHGDVMEQIVFFAALLPPDDKKKDILEFCWNRYYAELQFEDLDIDPFLHAYNQLWRYHLLKKAEENDKMHRLTQAGLLQIMKEKGGYAETVRLLAEALADCPFMSHERWIELLELHPDMVKHLKDALPSFLFSLLSPDDWVQLLTKDESFLSVCPDGTVQLMNGADWARLLGSQPQLADRCPWDSLDGDEWTDLLIAQPQFADRCQWDKLGGHNWAYLLCYAPQFADKCPWDKLGGSAWSDLLSTDDQFADKCSWEKLTEDDWVSLLESQPSFADKCPWDKLTGKGWCNLLRSIPQFADKCPWDKLGGNAWINLLQSQPQFADKCPWDKLDAVDHYEWGFLCSQHPQFIDKCPQDLGGGIWADILKGQPQLADQCPWDRLNGDDWAGLLVSQPQFADRCPWDKLQKEDVYNWTWLLQSQPQFADKCPWDKLQEELSGCAWQWFLNDQPHYADKCPWDKLDGGDWARLLCRQPQFADKCPWNKLESGDWASLLGSQPQFADNCPWNDLAGAGWAEILRGQPQFADRCPWDKLESGDWASLLGSQPQFADKCPWEKLKGGDWAWLLRSQPQFADKCPWDDLTGADWARLLSNGSQSQFADRCPWDKLEGKDWVEILVNGNDSLPFRMPWTAEMPYADKCPWDKLTGEDWAELLSQSLKYADKCRWDKLEGKDWSSLLSAPLFLSLSPGEDNMLFADKCPWDKLTGEELVDIVSMSPQYAKMCLWEKLNREDWERLLIFEPRFAKKCPFEDLSDADSGLGDEDGEDGFSLPEPPGLFDEDDE